jgi:hypothetical protein
MQITRYSTAAVSLLVIVMIAAFFGYGGKDVLLAEVAQGQGEWAQRNYDAALNVLLPGGAIKPDEFPKSANWIATVRILPPHENPEYRFSIQKTYDGKVIATVAAPKGASILSQLRRLKSSNPGATLEEITKLVSIESRTFTLSECQQLGQLVSQLEAINMSPLLPDELRMDETGYEFWFQSLYGDRMHVMLGGPGPNADKQPHALVQWAEDARKILTGRCSAPTNR